VSNDWASSKQRIASWTSPACWCKNNMGSFRNCFLKKRDYNISKSKQDKNISIYLLVHQSYMPRNKCVKPGDVLNEFMLLHNTFVAACSTITLNILAFVINNSIRVTVCSSAVLIYSNAFLDCCK
jgi:hypothetical protein